MLFWRWRNINLKALHVVSSTQDWGKLRKNRGLGGEALTVGGKQFYSGLVTHANSNIVVRLHGSPKRLIGSCGYPDYVNGAEIYCQIKSEDKILFASTPLNAKDRIQPFDVPVKGLDELTLQFFSTTASINAAHAAWLNIDSKE
jgi:hypothetical protein